MTELLLCLVAGVLLGGIGGAVAYHVIDHWRYDIEIVEDE